MPFLVPVFANNMARYFDPESPAYEGVTGDVSGVASPGTAKGWSESLKLASTAIFPPSVTIPAAEAAAYGILAGWSTNNDSAGNVLKSAIDAFYATYAAGCLPTFAAVPPTQCPIESTYPGGMSGISHTMWATNCGNVIANWLLTGTWTNTFSGATGPWV
jgi:hypothetical protein|tara:strand:+ start:907 stop:1386 length:480 start_codon:yes stop_codon:yes gene_type:complete